MFIPYLSHHIWDKILIFTDKINIGQIILNSTDKFNTFSRITTRNNVNVNGDCKLYSFLNLKFNRTTSERPSDHLSS
jgi:hypothetical protein